MTNGHSARATSGRQSRNSWPSLPIAEWAPTRDTLHLLTQIVGKVRMANTPTVNHWWNVPLYVTARGLTTSLIPHSSGPAFQIDFDLQDHRLHVVTESDQRRSFLLRVAAGRRVLCGAHDGARRASRRHSHLAHAGRDRRCHTVHGRPDARDL